MASGFVTALVVTVPEMPTDQPPLTNALILIAGFSTGVTLVVLLSVPLILLSSLSNFLRKGSIGEKRYDISEKCFTEDNGHRVRRIEWPDIKGIYMTSRYIFVKITRFQYAIIPSRDFTGKHELASFYTDMVKHKEQFAKRFAE